MDSSKSDKGSDDMDTDGPTVQIIQRGVISHWEGLEALLYSTLFQQVGGGGGQHVSCFIGMHASFTLQGLSNTCAGMQLGWMENEEGLVVVSEPLFFPRVTHSFPS